jgi:hypothetical protein
VRGRCDRIVSLKTDSMPGEPPQPVASPCTSVCRMNPTGLCEGCLRTLDEIAGWLAMDDAARRAVWREIARRRGNG